MSENFKLLILNLSQLTELHNTLLTIVTEEQNILIAAQLEELQKNNLFKETTLEKIAQANIERVRLVNEICKENGLTENETRLLDLAHFFEGNEGESLRRSHQELSQLLRSIKERNLKNEELIQNALNGITGAMNNVRDTLKAKPTYQSKGSTKNTPTESGQLMSRRA